MKYLDFTFSNQLGQIILTQSLEGNDENNRLSLNVEDLPVGVYFLTIQSENQLFTKKLVKQK